MKRIIIFTIILSLTHTICAQTSADTTDVPKGEILQKVDLGIEAGVSFLKM